MTALEQLKLERAEAEAKAKAEKPTDEMFQHMQATETKEAHAKAIIAADEAKERSRGGMGDGAMSSVPSTDPRVASDEEPEGEKPEVITLSREELNKALRAIVEDYTGQLEQAKGERDRLKLTLEMQSAKEALGKTGGKVEVIAVSHGPIDHQGALVQLHQEKLKGKRARFVTNKPDLRSLRRSQGFEPILDADGNEVRYIDGVLMAMPEERHRKEVREPRDRLRRFRRKGIPARFHEKGQESGVETFGDISYDKGEP